MSRTDIDKMSKDEEAGKMDKENKAGSDRGSIDSVLSFSKPSMPPPPYFDSTITGKSSFEATINDRLQKSVKSPFRLTVRLLQLAFALASGISYAIELDHRYSASTSNFIYAEVVFGLTLLALIFDSVTIRYYRFIWAIEWTMAVMWIACFGLFYKVYLNGEVPADYAVVDFGRMKVAGWCNLVNAILWLGNALFSSVSRCSEVQAAIKRRQKKGGEGGEGGNSNKTFETMAKAKSTTITAEPV